MMKHIYRQHFHEDEKHATRAKYQQENIKKINWLLASPSMSECLYRKHDNFDTRLHTTAIDPNPTHQWSAVCPVEVVLYCLVIESNPLVVLCVRCGRETIK